MKKIVFLVVLLGLASACGDGHNVGGGRGSDSVLILQVAAIEQYTTSTDVKLDVFNDSGLNVTVSAVVPPGCDVTVPEPVKTVPFDPTKTKGSTVISFFFHGLCSSSNITFTATDGHYNDTSEAVTVSEL